MPELTFPCQYPLKVMGRDEDDFEGFVFELLSRHVPGLRPGDLRSTRSRQGTYVSVSVTFTAGSREQVDNLYRDLGTDRRVLTAL